MQIFLFPTIVAIEIDLKSKELETTSKFYARLQTALSNESLSTFTLSVTWDPPKEIDEHKRICPSSIAKYFADLGYDVDLIQTECRTSIEYGLKIPMLGPESDELVEVNGTSNFFATPHELAEYAGMLALGCRLEQVEYLNTWSFSGHSMEVGNALIIRLKGLFSCDLIKMLFRKLQ